jgi:hypothetical protein
MRYTSAYYLLLLYSIMMLYPMLPIVSDAWSHAFNEIEHITTVHFIYGSNHLEKELVSVGNLGKNNKSSRNSIKITEQFQVHIVAPSIEHDFGINTINGFYLFYNPPRIIATFLSNPFQPPRSS